MALATQNDKPAGRLYLVATPIGNLEDITLRALRVLQECDFIACEDTRQTQKLLSHFEIAKRLVSYHEHNEMTRAPELVIELEQGARIALVSDAGTPLVSDPGHRLVTLCLRHHVPVVPVPGPSAIVAALAASGLPTDEFLFAGFLPSRAADRREALRRLAGSLAPWSSTKRRTGWGMLSAMRGNSWETGKLAWPEKSQKFMKNLSAERCPNWLTGRIKNRRGEK